MYNIYDDREPGSLKKYWGNVARTYLSMLFYSGVTGVIGYALRFIVGMFLQYSFYKEEIVEYSTLAVCLIIYPLLIGFKHVENLGYVDSFDGVFGIRAFMSRTGVATAGMLVIPMMIALKINFLVVYVYNMCYYASDGVSEVISETFLHRYDGSSPLGIVIGTTLTFALYLLAMIPFYYLGRRHHRQDVADGIKISVV